MPDQITCSSCNHTFAAKKTKVQITNNQAEAVDKQIESLVRGLYGVES